MKTNIYRPVLIRILLFILISLYFITVFGQSPASNRNENLVSPSSCIQKYSSINHVDYLKNTVIGFSKNISVQNSESVSFEIITNGAEKELWQTINSSLYFGNHCFFPLNRREKQVN